MTDSATSIDRLNDYAEVRLVTSVIQDLKARVSALVQSSERKEELLQSLGVAEASAMLLSHEIAIEASPSLRSAVRASLVEDDVVSLDKERIVRRG